mgnify:CR=1 FL=1
MPVDAPLPLHRPSLLLAGAIGALAVAAIPFAALLAQPLDFPCPFVVGFHVARVVAKGEEIREALDDLLNAILIVHQALNHMREDGMGVRDAVLESVRTARNDGYDRIVFEFDDHVPDYDVRWVDDPTECGSGEPVDAGAPAALQVGFRPAVAHDEEGRITVRERAFRPGLPALRTARISCDFEADVTWVLGVAARVEMRVLRLASPPRVVVDLRHR